MELVEGEELPARWRSILRCPYRAADRRRPRSRARKRHRASRPEASQHQDHARGRVKVLDFGLAQSPAPSRRRRSHRVAHHLSHVDDAGRRDSRHRRLHVPRAGARQAVDKRADIWAFGVVLYEMLAGKPLFGHGETLTDVIAAVVTREPDWGALPDSTPPHVRGLLERCLRKDPKLRMRDIGEARIAWIRPPARLRARNANRRDADGRGPGLWRARFLRLAQVWDGGARCGLSNGRYSISGSIRADAVPSLHDGHAISRDGRASCICIGNPPADLRWRFGI